MVDSGLNGEIFAKTTRFLFGIERELFQKYNTNSKAIACEKRKVKKLRREITKRKLQLNFLKNKHKKLKGDVEIVKVCKQMCKKRI